jgi:hypothetical protein
VKWLYFPFKDISADPVMPENLKRYQKKYGANGLIVRQFGDGYFLDRVGDDDMFIVAGHGAPEDERIGVSVKAGGFFGMFGQTVQESITANDLADMLYDWGLPRSHKYIKTISCGGAGMATAADAQARALGQDDAQELVVVPLKAVNSTNCFASVFAKAMFKRGYWQILVRGYPGFVNAMELQKMLTMESEDQGSTGRGFTTKDWGDNKVKMVKVPTKTVYQDFWFDGYGRRVRGKGDWRSWDS